MSAVQELPIGTWSRAPASASNLRNDAVLAGVLALSSALSAMLYSSAGFYEKPAPIWVAALCIAGGSLPLAFRRRWPLVVAPAVAAAFVATQLLRVPEVLFVNIELFIALYSAGAWAVNRQLSVLVRAAIVGGMFAWLFAAFATQGSAANSFVPPGDPGGPVSPYVAIGLISVITNVLYFGGAWYFGERAWAAARQRDELAARTLELERERERTAAQAISLERLRIARELHDVVAHHVSVMGVQAGAARRQWQSHPEAAVASLVAIESSARDAVDEMHQLLSTLRDDDTDPASSPSTRGVDQLEPLVHEASSERLPIRFRVVGEPRRLPPTVDLTVFRITQEAITNSIKHAGAGASADVRLRYLDDHVEIEITDTGVGARRGSGAGRGQVGMRERVAAVGGTLELGSRDRGGYLVRASIPAVGGAS
jgi:signal transduction histidine kinase